MGARTRVMSEEHTSLLWAGRNEWKSQAWKEGTHLGFPPSVQWWHSFCWWCGDHTFAEFLTWFLGQCPLYSIWEPCPQNNAVGRICPQYTAPSCLCPIASTLRCIHPVFFLQDNSTNPTHVKDGLRKEMLMYICVSIFISFLVGMAKALLVN